MKKFKDLTKGDKLYEVFSDKLITHKVASSVTVEKATLIPLKSLYGKHIYVFQIPKTKGGECSYKFPHIYKAYFTSLDDAKMGLKSNLERFKESAEWRISQIKESLEREEAKLLRIMDDLQNL